MGTFPCPQGHRADSPSQGPLGLSRTPTLRKNCGHTVQTADLAVPRPTHGGPGCWACTQAARVHTLGLSLPCRLSWVQTTGSAQALVPAVSTVHDPGARGLFSTERARPQAWGGTCHLWASHLSGAASTALLMASLVLRWLTHRERSFLRPQLRALPRGSGIPTGTVGPPAEAWGSTRSWECWSGHSLRPASTCACQHQAGPRGPGPSPPLC